MSVIDHFRADLDHSLRRRGATSPPGEPSSPPVSDPAAAPRSRPWLVYGGLLITGVMAAYLWLPAGRDPSGTPLPPVPVAEPTSAHAQAAPDADPNLTSPAMLPPAPAAPPGFMTVKDVGTADAPPPLPRAFEPPRPMPIPVSGPQLSVKKNQSPAQRADQRYQQAWDLARQNQVPQAIRQLQALLLERPEHHPSRLLLSQLLLTQGQAQQARDTLAQALAQQPDNEALRMGLARLEVHLGQSGRALELLDRQGTQPHSAEYRALHAVVMQSQEQHARATEQFIAALREQPNNAVWLVGLGVSLQALGRQTAAQEAFALARGSASYTPQLDAVVRRYSGP